MIDAVAAAIYEVMPDTFTRREHTTATTGARSHLVTYPEPWDDACEETKARCRKQAVAALMALREPSERMPHIAAAKDEVSEECIDAFYCAIVWRAMIDALIAEVRPETMNTDPQAGRPNP